MVKFNNKNTRRTSLIKLNIFYTFFSVSIVDFEQVNLSWVVNSVLNLFCRTFCEIG